MKTLKDVKPGDKVFILNSNRGYLKEPQIEILTANKVGILYIYRTGRILHFSSKLLGLGRYSCL